MKLTGELKKQVALDDELEMVSGGNQKDYSTYDSCPPGAKEEFWMINYFPGEITTSKWHFCPECSGFLEDKKFWFGYTKHVYNGFICKSNPNHKWVYGNPI